jgi:hypothetical protein
MHPVGTGESMNVANRSRPLRRCQLVVGLWALASRRASSTWLQIELSADGQCRTDSKSLAVIGWIGVAMSALHLLAITWLRSEKREAIGSPSPSGSLASSDSRRSLTGGLCYLAGSFAILLVDGRRTAVALVLAMMLPQRYVNFVAAAAQVEQRPVRSAGDP